MYKVIFLDDEAITLQMLEHAIDWRAHGVAVCGTAVDGEEGIELFRLVEPDIVIVDIRMPRMNGIEFVRAVRASKKRVKILILSAYAEFEYAQSAITYQVSEYLLKPLNEDKLEAAIVQVVQELDRDKTLSSTVEQYRLEHAEQLLQQLLTRQPGGPVPGVVLPPEILDAYGRADTLIHLLRVTEPEAQQLHDDLAEIRLFLKDRLGAGTAIVAVSPVELVALAASLNVPEGLREVVRTLRHRGQMVLAGLSPLEGPLNLFQARAQAEHALFACFYSEEQLCAASGELTFSNKVTLSLADFEHPITRLVDQGTSDDLNQTLQNYIAELVSRRLYPPLLYDAVFDILNWLKLALARQYQNPGLTALASVDRYRLRACATRTGLARYLSTHLQTVEATVSVVRATNSAPSIVGRAKAYTREHFSETTFSLQEVAEYVGLSKNHFSKVFHKTVGLKFWDYVTQLRIEKAKELLKTSNCSSYEICRAIGYESEFYFSKIFKRVVGIAPQQFRRS